MWKVQFGYVLSCNIFELIQIEYLVIMFVNYENIVGRQKDVYIWSLSWPKDVQNALQAIKYFIGLQPASWIKARTRGRCIHSYSTWVVTLQKINVTQLNLCTMAKNTIELLPKRLQKKHISLQTDQSLKSNLTFVMAPALNHCRLQVQKRVIYFVWIQNE